MRIADVVHSDRTLILDGALATELVRHGADLDHPLWSARVLLESPGMIGRVRMDYLEAGADVITTASYQASHEGMLRCGYGDKDADAIINLSVELAGYARQQYHQKNDRPIYIAGSIGPYGAMLHDGSEYAGDYGVTRRELGNFHQRRLSILEQTDVDILAIETIPSVLELESLIELLSNTRGPDAWISMSCKDAEHACDGTSIEACAQIVDRCDRVIAFGINCTAPEHASDLLRRIANVITKPIVVYPNSGEQYDAEQSCWVGCDEDGLPVMPAVREWQALGARLIGGCCRTTPEWIARVSQELKTSDR